MHHVQTWGAGTLEHPRIVKRDNPQFEGHFPWFTGNSSWASGEWSHNFDWYGVTGTLKIHEFSPYGTFFADQVSALRPITGSYAHPNPLNALWASRAGLLVHDNIYEVMDGRIVNETVSQSTSSLFVKLSDDVELVPVFIVSWVHPENPDFHYIPNAAALFDFMSLGVNHSPHQNFFWEGYDPAADEAPPDEIWKSCNIQFQIMGAVKLVQEVPAMCDPAPCAYDFLSPWTGDPPPQKFRSKFSAALGNPGLATYILDEIRPLFVHYGGLNNCEYLGKACVNGRFVHVHQGYRFQKPYTSHEIGHILLGGGHADPQTKPNNLMLQNANGTELTPDDCEQARGSASYFTASFRKYNQEVGRTTPPPPPPAQSHPEIGHLTDGPQVCCQLDDGTKTVTRMGECMLYAQFAGASVVNLDACKHCCDLLGNPPDATYLLDCAPENILAHNLCGTMCCSHDPYTGQPNPTYWSKHGCFTAGYGPGEGCGLR